jgi:hypothetical protein
MLPFRVSRYPKRCSPGPRKSSAGPPSQISSRHFWREERKNPVREVITLSMLTAIEQFQASLDKHYVNIFFCPGEGVSIYAGAADLGCSADVRLPGVCRNVLAGTRCLECSLRAGQFSYRDAVAIRCPRSEDGRQMQPGSIGVPSDALDV